MNKDTTYYESLIASYLSGEAKAAEAAELNTWLRADAGNMKLFREMRKAWLMQEALNVENSTDLDSEWEALTSRTGLYNKSTAKKLSVQTRRSFLRIAAVFLLLIIPSMVYYWFLLPPDSDMLFAENQMLESTLPDGTQVALNAGSSLKYPEKFNGKERKVTLHGEAFFDVSRDEKKAFVIEAQELQIKVLGTSFYVNTRSDDNTMEVVLIEGSVQLDFNKKQMVLEPGDKAVILKQHGEIIRQENTDPNLLAWKTKVLRFTDAPMYEIIDVLQNVYHKDISVLNPDINNCRITATFEGQSLEAILIVLQSTIDMRAKPRGNSIELSGTGCPK
jgi:ferric-dicitrate binding protein FerR (iron transport regulator)